MPDFSTSPSLLQRIQNADDSVSWAQFSELYCPVIYRFCRRRGLQDADALEVMQEVLTQIFRYISSFHYDSDRGSFRSWVYSVTRNRIVRHWRKTRSLPKLSSIGFTECLNSIEQHAFDAELTEELTNWVFEKVQSEVSSESWAAFRMTWLEQKPPSIAAQMLGRPVGWIYVAKSRVLKRLTDQVREFTR